MYSATPESATLSLHDSARTVVDTAEWLANREGWPTLAAREAAHAALVGRAREIATKIAVDRVPTWFRVYMDLYDDVIAKRLVLADATTLRLPALQGMCQDAARFAVREREEGLARAAREQHEAWLEEQEAERARLDAEAELELESYHAHLMAEQRGAA